MNMALFKMTTKNNWAIGLIIFAVMLMYMLSIITMFDPDSMDAINAMMEMFPMIYSIIVANRLIAKHVDSGSIAYLLATPNSRLTIVATQAVYLITSITALFALVTVTEIGISESMFPDHLDVGGFLLINLSTLFTFYAISGICFFFSCLFNDTKYSLGFGAGVPIAFFVINMLANVGEKYSWLSNFTLFALLDTTKILSRDLFTSIANIILLCIAVITYACGIIAFNHKDLYV